jgi:hypothetical protein
MVPKIGGGEEVSCKQHGDSYHGDGYHGDGYHGDVAFCRKSFWHLGGNTEVCHCLVHVPGLVEDKGQNRSSEKLLDSIGNLSRSDLNNYMKNER